MSLGFVNNKHIPTRAHAPTTNTRESVVVVDDSPKTEEASTNMSCMTLRGPGLSILRSAIMSVPFFMFFVDQTAVALSLIVLPFIVFTANCPKCWYAMANAAYTGTSILLLDRLYEDSLRFYIFTGVVAAHLIPFYLVVAPKLLTFLSMVGPCVQIAAWTVIGQPSGVDVSYLMLPVFTSLFLQMLIWYNMVYLKIYDITYAYMFYKILTCREVAKIEAFYF